MISVIVPVYNVETYLGKCLDSIMGQTYRDLEILVIDDGSTDRSGEICDRFAKKDERIRVFHTENRGLSAARNLGLDHARGTYIGFVDSDDWIEPDMYEVLLNKAEETGADVVECGVFREYPGNTKEHSKKSLLVSGMEANLAMLREELSTAVWNKLWKRRCFGHIRFPEGRVYEDIATTYQIFASADCVCAVNVSKYHYLQRRNSLSRMCDMKNLVGFWRSQRERFVFLWDKVDEAAKETLLRLCALAAARTWAHYYDCTAEDRKMYCESVREMNAFAKQRFPLFGNRKWKLSLRIGVFFPHFPNRLSFGTAWLVNRVVTVIIQQASRLKTASKTIH